MSVGMVPESMWKPPASAKGNHDNPVSSPAQKNTRVKWLDLHGESCKITEAPDKTLRPPQVQESNHWPTNIVSSLTLPKFQLASFNCFGDKKVHGGITTACYKDSTNEVANCLLI